MGRGANGFARVLLFAFGVLAPVAWGVLTYLKLSTNATEAALALTVLGASTGMLLQWAWLSRMERLGEQLERRPSPEPASPRYGQAVYVSGAQATDPSPTFGKPAAAPTPAAKPATAAGKGGGGAAHTARGPASPPPAAVAPTSPAWHEPVASYGSKPERRPEAVPPPFPARPAPSESEQGFGGTWSDPAPPRAEPARGRRLEPTALAAAWNDLLINGNGVFDARSLVAALAAAGVEAEILPPDNFVGLGVHLLVAAEPGQRERAFLLPDFGRPPKAFTTWFDLGPAATGPSGRMERLSRPAELKRKGAGYELALRGRIE